ncbi:hypothetical protein WCD74_01995 [Actinomycetospora sp. OC33-EN08]|uniref:Uncharacterized protein n=1 Tax=Actinomycetospora aurantiaca TaxID=3129233 RepID=A0ABU8MHV2_9PSEU
MTQVDRTTPAVTHIPAPRRPLEPWTPTPPSGIRWMDAGGAPVPPSPRRSRRPWWIAAGVVVLLAVSGLIASSVVAANRTMSVQGSVVVSTAGLGLPGVPCAPRSVTGRSVSVFGSDGRLVATAPMPATGYAVDRWRSSRPYADGCRFDVLFTDVPANDTLYRVGVGGSIADTVGFTREQLTTTGAQVTVGR